MTKFDDCMRRIDAIFGDAVDRAFQDRLDLFFESLKANLQLPCEVTGRQEFWWEEPYILGGWSEEEHKRLQKPHPASTDKYQLLRIEQGEWAEWMIFSKDIIAHVRCMSDGKELDLGLAELQATDKKSSNFQLVDDYAVWLVNNR
jgi:hypothetical protein